jgi:hypothetical protein
MNKPHNGFLDRPSDDASRHASMVGERQGERGSHICAGLGSGELYEALALRYEAAGSKQLRWFSALAPQHGWAGVGIEWSHLPVLADEEALDLRCHPAVSGKMKKRRSWFRAVDRVPWDAGTRSR